MQIRLQGVVEDAQRIGQDVVLHRDYDHGLAGVRGGVILGIGVAVGGRWDPVAIGSHVEVAELTVQLALEELRKGLTLVLLLLRLVPVAALGSYGRTVLFVVVIAGGGGISFLLLGVDVDGLFNGRTDRAFALSGPTLGLFPAFSPEHRARAHLRSHQDIEPEHPIVLTRTPSQTPSQSTAAFS